MIYRVFPDIFQAFLVIDFELCFSMVDFEDHHSNEGNNEGHSNEVDHVSNDIRDLAGRQRENCQNYIYFLKLERKRLSLMITALEVFVVLFSAIIGFIFHSY